MKILFIHGFASSGAYKTAATLRSILRPCEVISLDVPIEPEEALKMLRSICERETPDLIVGLSLGGFWAQKLRGYRKILINPEFNISGYLRGWIGPVRYLSPRRDGAEIFFVTEDICKGYEIIQQSQFENITPEEVALTKGMFASGDTLVHCRDIFSAHYPGRAVDYPGEHLPTFPELKKYLVPLVESLEF
ncbi:MAG: hypothetical protein MJY62_02470 [Bacteroidales bacterium]|nr:hypothetical protein [Bacteroidales bacterium]